jgi:serine/threonine protein kinase
MPLLIASQSELIPGYRLVERLGQGGFGEVWKAEAPGGVFKAVKIIHGSLSSATTTRPPPNKNSKPCSGSKPSVIRTSCRWTASTLSKAA